MSFEEGRENLDRVDSLPVPNSAASNVENELPLPPKPGPNAPGLPSSLDGESHERMQHVMQSDIGISTLLNRLKQSISSARDFAAFLKERSSIEEKHAQSLKRLSRGTHEVIRRPESKGGSFASNFEEMTKVHDRMADNGLQFSNNLYQMHDELQELTSKCERDRKHLKQTGLEAEKRVQDAESAMNKAKVKYNSLADSYDRARTGERQSGKFGISTKSAEKQEEDLHRKLETADGDYASKVQAAQAARQDLVRTHRPQAVRNLEESTKECDAGLTLQLSKYAALSEKMLLGNGLCVSPLRSQAAGASKSLREIAQNVDNHRDFQDYILSFSAKAGSRQPEIKYEKHPALSNPQQQRPTQPTTQTFDSAQSQYGTPERTNTYDSFQQGHRPSNPGQISGVMPYQPPSTGPMSPGQQNQFQSPLAQSPYAPHAPQLPQIGSIGPDPALSADMPQSRDGQTSNQRPPQFAPTMGAMPPTSAAPLDYSRAPTQSSTLDGFRAPPQSSLERQAQPSITPADVASPPSGQDYHPDARGPSISSLGSGPSSRGPSFGQPSDFTAGGRPPPPGNLRTDTVPPQPSSYRQDTAGAGLGGPVPGGPAYPQAHQAPAGGPVGQPHGGYRGAAGPVGTAALPSNQRRNETNRQNLPPTRPVFGLSLDELFRRDGTAVPSIVYQCVQAVDLFGLDTEGIYRTSGSAPHIMEMKALFDNDSTQVDFRNSASFHHDIASVTTLLKHFFRDLPDPVLTSAAYSQFIAAARIDDDHIRRDSLHAIINDLPDPNYATLRVVALHLWRVAQHSEKNRMTNSNLAICLGPTLMGQAPANGNGNGNAAADIKDAGWQARVVETILNNTLQIFDDDD